MSEIERERETSPTFSDSVRSAIDERLRASNTLQIHGLQWNLDSMLDGVKRCPNYDWHGRRSVWKPPDVVVHRNTGKLSLELALAADQDNFEAAKAGWKMEERLCAIGAWERFESDDHHGVGYTNGQHSICRECSDRFCDRPDFISGTYSETT